MFSRFRIALGLALTLAVILILPVFAGGWAVITLDQLTTNVAAGQPITVGFTVLQHGRTPMTDLDPTIVAQLSESESFVAHAKPEGIPGHYQATLTFPKEGEWEWSIYAFTMEQPMPALNVLAATPSANQSIPKTETPSISPLRIVRMLALLVGITGDRKSTRLNSSHIQKSRMPSSA